MTKHLLGCLTHRDTGNIRGGPTILIAEIGDPATEDVPRNADVTESATNDGQPVGLKIVIDIGPSVSWADIDRRLVIRQAELGKAEAGKQNAGRIDVRRIGNWHMATTPNCEGGFNFLEDLYSIAHLGAIRGLKDTGWPQPGTGCVVFWERVS